MDINPYHLLQSADELVLTKLKSSIEESLKNLTKQSFRVLHMVKRFREIYSDGKPLEEFIKKAKLDTWLMGFDNLNVKITRTFDDIKRHICNIIADDQPYFQISNKFDEFKQLQDQLKTLNFPSDPQHLLTLINQDKRALNSIVHQMERPDGKGHHVTSTNMLSDTNDSRTNTKPAQTQSTKKRDNSPSVPGPAYKELVDTSYNALQKPSANRDTQEPHSTGRKAPMEPFISSPYFELDSAQSKPVMPMSLQQQRRSASVVALDVISLTGVKEQFEARTFRRLAITQSLLVATLRTIKST